MTTQDLYFRALKKWGREMQLVVALEELSELQKEICKTVRNEYIPDYSKLSDEIADVLIMLEQMQEMFEVQEEVEMRKKYKLNRLSERLNCRSEFEAT